MKTEVFNHETGKFEDISVYDALDIQCLECGKKTALPANSIYFTVAGLNYFCPDKDCEDKYAWKQ